MPFAEILFIFIFLFGLAVGSFLNCLIYRLKINRDLSGRSFCPSCGHELSFFDLIPIFSYLFLKGRCRYCKEKISIQYPLVEILTALTFLMVVYKLKVPGSFLDFLIISLNLIIFSLLIVIFVYDLKYFIIPNKIIYPAIISSVVLFLIESFVEQDFTIALNYFLAGVLFFLFFLSIYLITKGKGIGFGDVRYASFLGFFLGFGNGLVALFFSFVVGAIIGIVLILLKNKSKKDAIPFGPFLVLGTFIAFFLGEFIIEGYFNLLI